MLINNEATSNLSNNTLSDSLSLRYSLESICFTDCFSAIFDQSPRKLFGVKMPGLSVVFSAVYLQRAHPMHV